MKGNRKQTAVKLTASKIGTHVMARVVTKCSKLCLHQEVVGVSLCNHTHFQWVQ